MPVIVGAVGAGELGIEDGDAAARRAGERGGCTPPRVVMMTLKVSGRPAGVSSA